MPERNEAEEQSFTIYEIFLSHNMFPEIYKLDPKVTQINIFHYNPKNRVIGKPILMGNINFTKQGRSVTFDSDIVYGGMEDLTLEQKTIVIGYFTTIGMMVGNNFYKKVPLEQFPLLSTFNKNVLHAHRAITKEKSPLN